MDKNRQKLLMSPFDNQIKTRNSPFNDNYFGDNDPNNVGQL